MYADRNHFIIVIQHWLAINSGGVIVINVITVRSSHKTEILITTDQHIHTWGLFLAPPSPSPPNYCSEVDWQGHRPSYSLAGVIEMGPITKN